MAVLSLAAAFPLLAGCGLEDALDAMQRENFEQACTKLGIARSSPSWDQCMIQQQASERYEEQQALNRIQQQENARKLTHGR
ncbi:hypothetical protein HMPREF9946_00140 [Acetobacteraceae bacterium AT-5844]|nr:hypothetical protein HMPREF9946_00140 [Acetobacteraceae bacterium AT-5844]